MVFQSPYPLEFRQQAIAMADAGLSYGDIGKHLNVSHTTAFRWANPYKYERSRPKRRPPGNKYPPEVSARAKALRESGMTYEKIGIELGINYSTAYYFVNPRYYKMVLLRNTGKRKRKWVWEEINGRLIRVTEQSKEARRLRRNGMLLVQIAKHFGVAKSTVQLWCNPYSRIKRNDTERARYARHAASVNTSDNGESKCLSV